MPAMKTQRVIRPRLFSLFAYWHLILMALAVASRSYRVIVWLLN
jgi:hypothetical protein